MTWLTFCLAAGLLLTGVAIGVVLTLLVAELAVRRSLVNMNDSVDHTNNHQ